LIRINAKARKTATVAPRQTGGTSWVRVFFRCPKTGEEFGSGFQAGPGDLRLLPAGAKINLRCRVCGVKHEFRFADARVDETEQNRPNR